MSRDRSSGVRSIDQMIHIMMERKEHRGCEIKLFNSSRLHVEYRDGVTSTAPIVSRKYTMTHSDDTAELYVTIGRKYAEDKIGPLRDEVLLEFQKNNHQLQLFGTVLIDDYEGEWNSKQRNDIFLREMPTALMAIRHADRELFETFPLLDSIPVYLWFQSTKNEYNKIYDFGTMKDYRTERIT